MRDRNRHAAEDERVKRQHRVPVEAPEQTSRSEIRHLMQSHLAWRVAAFDPPRQPRFAGQLHLGFENELMTRLVWPAHTFFWYATASFLLPNEWSKKPCSAAPSGGMTRQRK